MRMYFVRENLTLPLLHTFKKVIKKTMIVTFKTDKC